MDVQISKKGIAWSRGFFRAWIVVATIWIAACILLAWGRSDALTDILLRGVIPMIVLFGFGLAVAWVIKGFSAGRP